MEGEDVEGKGRKKKRGGGGKSVRRGALVPGAG